MPIKTLIHFHRKSREKYSYWDMVKTTPAEIALSNSSYSVPLFTPRAMRGAHIDMDCYPVSRARNPQAGEGVDPNGVEGGFLKEDEVRHH